ncbi:hypothetical protein [Streptomyces sp. NPDC085596]|uniref:hypothetical protein n=1 Tax=Streptomyces sp. NPDC085596 TaxID=3365731 RepID=UPI0037D7541A
MHTSECWAAAKSGRCRPVTRQQAIEALRQQEGDTDLTGWPYEQRRAALEALFADHWAGSPARESYRARPPAPNCPSSVASATPVSPSSVRGRPRAHRLVHGP